MAKPNGRGGWDLSDEDLAEVMAASFGDDDAAEVTVTARPGTPPPPDGPFTVVVWPEGGDPSEGVVRRVRKAGEDLVTDPPPPRVQRDVLVRFILNTAPLREAFEKAARKLLELVAAFEAPIPAVPPVALKPAHRMKGRRR